MAGIIDYVWQSTFCLFFFYGIYWCFLKNEKAFTLTRIFILIAPILALLFPIIEIPVDFQKPSISLDQTYFYQVLSSQEAPEEIVGEYGLPEVTVRSTKLPLLWEFKDYFILGYIFIILLLSIRLVWQFIQLHMLARKGWYETVYKLRDKYFLVPTFGLAPIFSFFNKLFWDDSEQLTPDEKQQIIQHEIEHIRQGHSYDVIYYQILSILFWFNPAIHLMRIALVDVHEYLADEKVLKKTDHKEAYKKLIIKIAFKGLELPLGNHFIRSTTLKRILMMKKSPKINWCRLLMILPLTGMLLSLVSMKYEQPTYSNNKITLPLNSIEEQWLRIQDSLNVTINVEKIINPYHYEYIKPLKDGKLIAQLGEIEYTFSNVSNDDKYVKVMGLLNSLRLNSTVQKNFEGVYKLHQVDKAPELKAGQTPWNIFLIQNLLVPENENKLGIFNSIEIEFIVDVNGDIKNPLIKRSYGGGLDKQLLAALYHPKAPRWSPGEINGKPVPVVINTNLVIASSIHTAKKDYLLEIDPDSYSAPKKLSREKIAYEVKQPYNLSHPTSIASDPYYLKIEVLDNESPMILTWDNKKVSIIEFYTHLEDKILKLNKQGILEQNVILHILGAADVKYGFIKELQSILKSKGINNLSYPKYIPESSQYSSTENIHINLTHIDTISMVEPLYVINGDITNRSALSDIKPKNIQSINVIKGIEAKEKYGNNAANGVVVFNLKNIP